MGECTTAHDNTSTNTNCGFLPIKKHTRQSLTGYLLLQPVFQIMDGNVFLLSMLDNHLWIAYLPS